MRTSARSVLILALALVTLVVISGCSSSKPKVAPPTTSDQMPWPAPPNPMALAVKAGLTPETAERLEYHVHAHLDVFVDGKQIVVPGGIGIDTTNPGVHSGVVNGFPAYGGIVVPCNAPCISPLHTHDATGVLHTESSTRKNNTLGQFFTEWNVKLTPTCVATYCSPATPISVYVNGTKFTGDPTTIPLSNLKEIAIVIGSPPAQIPGSFDTSLI
jgi:hypothetical protein